eukprot:comp20719_c0_seq1/m.27059 comp20719_c0_seq1/g.27059  ORF comp20719_c0_seq1/g.27059 comp20719_c0_seq1/m.27059 type:complete len:741 (-) comp20719_c0_seq1:481-2703(-)
MAPSGPSPFLGKTPGARSQSTPCAANMNQSNGQNAMLSQSMGGGGLSNFVLDLEPLDTECGPMADMMLGNMNHMTSNQSNCGSQGFNQSHGGGMMGGGMCGMMGGQSNGMISSQSMGMLCSANQMNYMGKPNGMGPMNGMAGSMGSQSSSVMGGPMNQSKVMNGGRGMMGGSCNPTTMGQSANGMGFQNPNGQSMCMPGMGNPNMAMVQSQFCSNGNMMATMNQSNGPMGMGANSQGPSNMVPPNGSAPSTPLVAGSANQRPSLPNSQPMNMKNGPLSSGSAPNLLSGQSCQTQMTPNGVPGGPMPMMVPGPYMGMGGGFNPFVAVPPHIAAMMAAERAYVARKAQVLCARTSLRKPRHRRNLKDLVRSIYCLHDGCGRVYATDGSLQNHLRIKHNNQRWAPEKDIEHARERAQEEEEKSPSQSGTPASSEYSSSQDMLSDNRPIKTDENGASDGSIADGSDNRAKSCPDLFDFDLDLNIQPTMSNPLNSTVETPVSQSNRVNNMDDEAIRNFDLDSVIPFSEAPMKSEQVAATPIFGESDYATLSSLSSPFLDDSGSMGGGSQDMDFGLGEMFSNSGLNLANNFQPIGSMGQMPYLETSLGKMGGATGVYGGFKSVLPHTPSPLSYQSSLGLIDQSAATPQQPSDGIGQLSPLLVEPKNENSFNGGADISSAAVWGMVSGTDPESNQNVAASWDFFSDSAIGGGANGLGTLAGMGANSQSGIGVGVSMELSDFLSSGFS